MNTTGTVSERLRQLEAASRSDNNTVAQPALQILGHVAQRHLIATVAALEAHYASHSEPRAIEETLAELETEPGAAWPPNGTFVFPSPRRVQAVKRCFADHVLAHLANCSAPPLSFSCCWQSGFRVY